MLLLPASGSGSALAGSVHLQFAVRASGGCHRGKMGAVVDRAVLSALGNPMTRAFLLVLAAAVACEVPRRPDLALRSRGPGCSGLPPGTLADVVPDRATLATGLRLETNDQGLLVVDDSGGVVGAYGPGHFEVAGADGHSLLVSQPLDRPHARADARWVPASDGRVQWEIPAEWWWPESGRRVSLAPESGCNGPREWSPDGRYYLALFHVRGAVENSQPAGLSLCSADGRLLDSLDISLAGDGDQAIDHGGRIVLSHRWGPGSNVVTYSRYRVGAKGGRSWPSVLAVSEGGFQHVQLDSSLVTFTEDGAAILQPSYFDGCRLYVIDAQVWKELGPRPDESMRGLGPGDPGHKGCRPCGTASVVSESERESPRP